MTGRIRFGNWMINCLPDQVRFEKVWLFVKVPLLFLLMAVGFYNKTLPHLRYCFDSVVNNIFCFKSIDFFFKLSG